MGLDRGPFAYLHIRRGDLLNFAFARTARGRLAGPTPGCKADPPTLAAYVRCRLGTLECIPLVFTTDDRSRFVDEALATLRDDSCQPTRERNGVRQVVAADMLLREMSATFGLNDNYFVFVVGKLLAHGATMKMKADLRWIYISGDQCAACHICCKHRNTSLPANVAKSCLEQDLGNRCEKIPPPPQEDLSSLTRIPRTRRLALAAHDHGDWAGT